MLFSSELTSTGEMYFWLTQFNHTWLMKPSVRYIIHTKNKITDLRSKQKLREMKGHKIKNSATKGLANNHFCVVNEFALGVSKIC